MKISKELESKLLEVIKQSEEDNNYGMSGILLTLHAATMSDEDFDFIVGHFSHVNEILMKRVIDKIKTKLN